MTLGACLSARAPAAPAVSVRAAFSPYRLGHSTTVRLRIGIAPAGELVPPPVLAGELLYPAGLNIQLSGLGIDACHAAALELFGLQACPPNSVMGYGSAVAELPIKAEVVRETAQIAVVRTDEQAGRPAILFYIYEEPALSAQIVLVAELLPATKPYEGLLDIHLPLIPTFFEGPDVTVSELSLVLGPKNLTYYERVRHKVLRYKPAGIPLPGHCPHRGFPFAVQLSFLGGAHAAGATSVPCPRVH